MLIVQLWHQNIQSNTFRDVSLFSADFYLPLETANCPTTEGEFGCDTNGDITVTDAIIGNGLEFQNDGAHLRYLNVDEGCFWQPDECTNGFTVSLWFKSDFRSVFSALFATLDNIPRSSGFQIATNDNGVGLQVYGFRKSTMSFTTYPDETSWHHFVGAWYSNGTIFLYMDGDFVDTFTAYNNKDEPGGIHNHVAYVGNSCLNQAYVGHLDEILFWEEVKNAEFVRMLHGLEPKIGNVFQ